MKQLISQLPNEIAELVEFQALSKLVHQRNKAIHKELLETDIFLTMVDCKCRDWEDYSFAERIPRLQHPNWEEHQTFASVDEQPLDSNFTRSANVSGSHQSFNAPYNQFLSRPLFNFWALKPSMNALSLFRRLKKKMIGIQHVPSMNKISGHS